MSAIEKEIIEASGFVQRRNYDDRQDYLAAIARAVDQLEDVDFDGLSPEAADWFNAAARAISNKKRIEDFPDAEPEEEAEEAVTEEALAEPEAEEEAPEEEAEPEPAPAKPKRSKATNPKLARPYKGDRRTKRGPEKGISPKNVNRWGVIDGTKNAAAIEMFEKGCRMKDVTAALGGTYYNLLQDMINRGHRVEKGAKGADGYVKVTHQVDIKKGKK